LIYVQAVEDLVEPSEGGLVDRNSRPSPSVHASAAKPSIQGPCRKAYHSLEREGACRPSADTCSAAWRTGPCRADRTVASGFRSNHTKAWLDGQQADTCQAEEGILKHHNKPVNLACSCQAAKAGNLLGLHVAAASC
jgi:hypothetical protein